MEAGGWDPLQPRGLSDCNGLVVFLTSAPPGPSSGLSSPAPEAGDGGRSRLTAVFTRRVPSGGCATLTATQVSDLVARACHP